MPPMDISDNRLHITRLAISRSAIPCTHGDQQGGYQQVSDQQAGDQQAGVQQADDHILAISKRLSSCGKYKNLLKLSQIRVLNSSMMSDKTVGGIGKTKCRDLGFDSRVPLKPDICSGPPS